MKKILAVIPMSLLGFVANAQNSNPYIMRYNEEVFQVSAAIVVAGMFMLFIINIIKRIFEHRLKNKIVDKGISESIAHSILDTRTREDNKNANLKWFSLLAGIGIGLMGVYYTQPLSFHSLAIMAFSISLSFLGYYFFTRKTEK